MRLFKWVSSTFMAFIRANTFRLQEFYSQCLKSQAIFLDALPWATSNAEQASARRTQNPPDAQSNAALPAATQDQSTLEEQLLNVMLGAHGELNEAFRM